MSKTWRQRYVQRGGRPGCSVIWELLYKSEYCSCDANPSSDYFKKNYAVGDNFSMAWPDLRYHNGVKV